MSEHELTAIVMTPHMVSLDVDDTLEGLDPGKEERTPTFEREVDNITCSCGKMFRPGDYRLDEEAIEAAQEHLREARSDG